MTQKRPVEGGFLHRVSDPAQNQLEEVGLKVIMDYSLETPLFAGVTQHHPEEVFSFASTSVEVDVLWYQVGL